MLGEVVERAIAEFEDTNGTKVKDLNTKQLIIILHSELKEKIDNHIKWGESENKRLSKVLNDHDILFERIFNTLPEKGFCGKVNSVLWPEKPELPLDQKVNIIWHDRRWLKYIFIAIITLGGGNILLSFL